MNGEKQNSVMDLVNRMIVRIFSLRIDQVSLAVVEVAQFVWRLHRAHKLASSWSGRARLLLRGLQSEQTSWMLGLLREVASADPRAALAVKMLEQLKIIPALCRVETVEEVLRDLPRVVSSIGKALTVQQNVMSQLEPTSVASPPPLTAGWATA